jgi:hypothetical protein
MNAKLENNIIKNTTNKWKNNGGKFCKSCDENISVCWHYKKSWFIWLEN